MKIENEDALIRTRSTRIYKASHAGGRRGQQCNRKTQELDATRRTSFTSSSSAPSKAHPDPVISSNLHLARPCTSELASYVASCTSNCSSVPSSELQCGALATTGTTSPASLNRRQCTRSGAGRGANLGRVVADLKWQAADRRQHGAVVVANAKPAAAASG
jgi:hypothetical protein